MNLMERLDNLRALIEEPEFLEGKGLSNEVNIRIFCYDPKDEMAVRHFTEKLVTDTSLSCRLIEYNLYDVFLSICNDKRITDRIAEREEKKGKKYVLDQMKCMANNTAFITKMQYGRRYSHHGRGCRIPVYKDPCPAGCHATVFLRCAGTCDVSRYLRWKICKTV